MPIFGNLGSFLKGLGDQMDGLLKQVTDAGGLDRLTAIGVLVGRADGELDSDEIERLKDICSRNMPHFTADQIRGSFVANKARSDAELHAIIEKAPAGEADVLVRAGLAIGSSDGDFDEKEQAVMRKVCLNLFLKPSDFSL